MRLFSLLLIFAFLFGTLEPLAAWQASSRAGRCCCGGKVCYCAHPQGRCPLKKQTALGADENFSPKTGSQSPFLKDAGCGHPESPASLVSHSKEFYIQGPHPVVADPKSDFIFPLPSERFFRLFDHRLEKPPQLPLSRQS